MTLLPQPFQDFDYLPSPTHPPLFTFIVPSIQAVKIVSLPRLTGIF